MVEKNRVYNDIQKLAEMFKNKTGNIICRELLKSNIHISDMTESEKVYCQKKPCAKLVISAAKVLDDFISENQLN